MESMYLWGCRRGIRYRCSAVQGVLVDLRGEIVIVVGQFVRSIWMLFLKAIALD